jgi:hypothetical protein
MALLLLKAVILQVAGFGAEANFDRRPDDPSAASAAAATYAPCSFKAPAVLFRHKSWTRYGFGRWLTDGAQRLHKNVLVIKLTRIAWAVLYRGSPRTGIYRESHVITGSSSSRGSRDGNQENGTGHPRK